MKKNEFYYSDDYYLYGYLQRGIYVDKLKHWIECFSKDQILILQSEELFRNPEVEYKKILKFLELPDWKLKEYKQYKAGKYKKPEMTATTKNFLKEFFKPHNQRLYELTGKNFHWDD